MLTDAHYAEKRAYFALDMRRTAAIDADLPSADDLVRACLQAIQVSPEQAAIRQAGQDLASIDAGPWSGLLSELHTTRNRARNPR